MSVYTQYSTSASRKFFVAHRCSKCDAMNMSIQDASAKRYYNDKGAFTSKQLTKRRDSAVTAATDDLNALIQRIYDDAARRRYSTAKIRCKCQNCNHEEPWAKLHFTVARTITKFTSILAVIAVLILVGFSTDDGMCATFSGRLSYLLPFWLPAVLSWLIPTGYMVVAKIIRNKQVDRMERKHLPMIAVTEQRAKELILKLHADKSTEKQE